MKEIPTPLTDNAMRQMACFADHPAVQCLNDLARRLERDRHELIEALKLCQDILMTDNRYQSAKAIDDIIERMK